MGNKLYSKYPRLAATAEHYGFSCNDIDSMIRIINTSRYRDLIWMDNIELPLKALMVRIDVHKTDFNKKISELYFVAHKSIDELREIIGIMQLPLVYALYFG